MTEEEIKLKIEEEEKKEKKKATIKKILIIVGALLFIVILIVLGNVDFFVKMSDKNKYDRENNYYLRPIKQDTYLEGYLNKEFNIKYFMYSFNVTNGGRDYLVAFWNTTDTSFEIKYKDISTILGPNDTTAVVVTEEYSSNKGAYLNFKDFVATPYDGTLPEFNNESSYNEEKKCINNLPIGKVLVLLDDNSYIKNALVIDKEEYCQEQVIGSYLVLKK